MSKEMLQGIVAHGVAILDAWDATAEDLASTRGPNDEKFDLDQIIPGLNPAESVNSLGRQLWAAIEITTSLSSLVTLTGVPRTHVEKLSSNIGALHTHIDALKVAVDSFRSKGSITSLNSSDLTAQNSADESLPLPSLLQNLNKQIDPVSNLAQLIRVFTASDAEIGQSIDLVGSARERQAEVLGDIAAGLEKLETAKGNAAAFLEATEASATNAKEFEEEGKEAKDAAVTASTEAQTALTKIQEVNDSATELKTTVDSYQATFDDFQKKLEFRNLSFEVGEKEKNKLIAELQKQIEETSRVQEKARSVLGEATVAGLSMHYFTEAKSVGKRLIRTQISLVASIVFFAVSAAMALNIPFFAELGLSPQAVLSNTGVQSNDVSVFQILASSFGKLIYLAPAAFLVVFTARRSADLFRLREEYTYKFTVAASLPGFKEEAPDFAEPINATAFKELLSNPVTHDGQRVEKGESWFTRLLQPGITKAVEKAMEKIKTAG